ncbi:MAG: 2-oxo acid dehydrogenase subunit E2, partial [Simkaniaceae bacterium]|nr:2-oxo acid dehydrogenase subunit E2 [Simkaniaceae bacterium]
PVAGVLADIKAQPDETLDVGAVICLIAVGEAAANRTEATTSETAQKNEPQEDMGDFYSPAVLRFARENRISMEELEKIPRTGGGGRLSRKDIQNYLSEKDSKSPLANQERVKMSGMRKAIADHMVKSFYEAPHASLIVDVDITNIMHHIKATKEAFFNEHGYKLTITSYIADAIAKSALEYPYINASLDGDTIVLKKFVNVGIAVSVDQAVLVPVIRNAHKLTVAEIAKQVADLAARAKNHALHPDDVQAGTITMTNFGMGGALIGIPIIRFPEVAIIGVGKIEKALCVMEDDSTQIRQKVHLSLTFDHRAIDGMYGCEFLAGVKRRLETHLTQK